MRLLFTILFIFCLPLILPANESIYPCNNTGTTPIQRNNQTENALLCNKDRSVLPQIINSLGMRFIYLEPGTFIMGSPQEEKGRKPDEVQHSVTLTKGFYLQSTEVTIKQWRKLMGSDPIDFTDDCVEDCPVNHISWDDSIAFIKKLNAKEGLNKYRLPTEAEWEYACRAKSTTAFEAGDNIETECVSDPAADKIAWYCANTKGQPKPVGTKPPNKWGLHDMNGNVYEWCSDWYGAYPSGPLTDPKGPATGKTKVFRGGAFMYLVWHARSAHRRHHATHFRNRYTGFRVAMNP
jgi:formylglycine-generating enzyme required for sulfatase activity